MKTIRQINVESRQGYFFNDMTNINYFDPSLLNIDKVLLKSIVCYLCMILSILKL